MFVLRGKMTPDVLGPMKQQCMHKLQTVLYTNTIMKYSQKSATTSQ